MFSPSTVKAIWVLLMYPAMKKNGRKLKWCQFFEIFNDLTNIISGIE